MNINNTGISINDLFIMMDKKASTTIVLTIIIILVLALVSVILYFVKFSNNVSNENSSSENIKTFQKVLNDYSICVKNKDIECQCKYLTKYHCEKLRETGSGPESEYAVNAKLIKGYRGIINLGTEGNTISGLDPKIYTRAINYFFKAKSREYVGDCLSISFVEENGEWKAFDVDGPVSVSNCE